MKVCTKCGEEKDVENFYKSSVVKSGHIAVCKLCCKNLYKPNSTKLKVYYRANKEKIISSFSTRYRSDQSFAEYRKLYAKKYSLLNADKIKSKEIEYRQLHKTSIQQKAKEYFQRTYNKNYARYAKNNSIRRCKKIKAVQPDHDFSIEANMYKLCKKLKKLSGITYHIDHIYPLSKGGPHHHDNLQIITAKENLSKGSSLDYRSSTCKHWTELPQHILDRIKITNFDTIQSIANC